MRQTARTLHQAAKLLLFFVTHIASTSFFPSHNTAEVRSSLDLSGGHTPDESVNIKRSRSKRRSIISTRSACLTCIVSGKPARIALGLLGEIPVTYLIRCLISKLQDALLAAVVIRHASFCEIRFGEKMEVHRMQTKLAALLVIVAIVMAAAGGFFGHDVIEGSASAKGPWQTTYVTADCHTAPECVGKVLTGDPNGDQSKIANLLARFDRDGCEWQPMVPYGSGWFVVLYRC